MATKNRGLAWCLAETQLLIDLWSENNMLNDQDGTTRNAAVYLKIAKQLEDNGFHRTTAQIRDRMKRLKRDYREVIDNNNRPEAAGRKTCHFFYELDRIFGKGSFSNSNIDLDNSPSLPVNVCSAELGKCLASDEDDAPQPIHSHQHTPNGMVYGNDPTRSVSDHHSPLTRKRLRKRLHVEEALHKEAEIVEDRSVNTEDMVGLEVEKLMLEMEKLREETGRVREERSKLALEKEILILQKRRLLREEREWRDMRMRQTKLRKVETEPPMPGDLADVSILGPASTGMNWRRNTGACGTENETAEFPKEDADVWERNSVSSPRALVSQALAVDPATFGKDLGLREGVDGGKCSSRDIQGQNGNALEGKQKPAGELSTAESLENGSRISSNSNSGMLMSQVDSIPWDGGFCGYLNTCQSCGHVNSCNRPMPIEKED